MVDTSLRALGGWERGETTPRGKVGLIEDLLDISLAPGGEAPNPVHRAVQQSELTVDRQHAVIAFYERMVREQAQGEAV